MSEQKVTVYDIARSANVSVSTVSRALNGSTLVADPRRTLIVETARRLGYEQRRIRRPTGRSILNILVVLPHASSPQAHLFYDATALFEGLVAGFGDTAMHAIAVPAGTSGPLESKKLGDIDGCVFAFSDPEPEFRRRLDERHVPTIYINRIHEGQSCVTSDAERGMEALARLAFEHHGSVPMCFLGLHDAETIGLLRLAALRTAIEKHRAESPGSRGRNVQRATAANLGDTWFDSAPAVTTDDVRSLFDAGYRVLFAMNDLLAVAVLDRLLRIGIDVPGQIAVAGYDAAPVGRLLGAKLTTVDLSVRQMAAAAGARLAKHIMERETAPGVVLVEGELIVGETL